MSDITKTPIALDGFDCQSGQPRSGVDYGKFDATLPNHWHSRDAGDSLKLGPYICTDCAREIIRWEDKRVIERIVERPGEALPDIDAMNDAVDRKEWVPDFNGVLRGPYVLNFTVYLVDPETGARVITSNSTIGQGIAFGNLHDRVSFMRRLKESRVYPIIMLSSATMKTKFGERKRPDFEIVDWRTLDGGHTAISGPVGSPVAPPTTGEITGGDSINY
jgi:hypothetical protein